MVMFLKLWASMLWGFGGISALAASFTHESLGKWAFSIVAGTGLLAVAVAVWL